MALKNCKECGKPVSTEAKACPNCGAKPPPKQVSALVIVLVCLIGVSWWIRSSRDEEMAATSSASIPAAKSKEDLRFDLAFDSAKAIKRAMRDPDSLKFEFIGIDDDASIACMKYRAKNGFGGMNSEIAVVVNRKVSQKPADWKKYCSKPMNDVTTAG